jgi:hypothetical protein
VQQLVSRLSSGLATSQSIVWKRSGAAEQGQDKVDAPDDLVSKLFDKL